MIAAPSSSSAIAYMTIVQKARKLELPVLSKDHLKLLAERLVFLPNSEMLLRRGGDLILILDSQYRHTTDAELTDLFHHISPQLHYRCRTINDGSARQLECVWCYVAIEPPKRQMSAFDYSWQFRQSLWSFL